MHAIRVIASFARPPGCPSLDIVGVVKTFIAPQAVRQVFSVLGSSKVLGSPLGLLSNLQAGVKVSEGAMHAVARHT